MKPKHAVLIFVALVLLIGGLIGWNQYRQVRADYDAYRTLIQQGVTVAGVDVGWHTSGQAYEKVWEWVAAPYYDAFTLHYQDDEVSLSPGDDLGFNIPVDEMVAEYTRRRQLMVHGLSDIEGVECVVPEGTFFCLVDVHACGRTSEELAHYLLRDWGLLTVPGSYYGASLEGYLRLSFSYSPGDILNGLELLAQGLGRLGS